MDSSQSTSQNERDTYAGHPPGVGLPAELARMTLEIFAARKTPSSLVRVDRAAMLEGAREVPLLPDELWSSRRDEEASNDHESTPSTFVLERFKTHAMPAERKNRHVRHHEMSMRQSVGESVVHWEAHRTDSYPRLPSWQDLDMFGQLRQRIWSTTSS